jgi:hypothetical protein
MPPSIIPFFYTTIWIDKKGWEKVREKLPTESAMWKMQIARRRKKKGKACGMGIREEIEVRKKEGEEDRMDCMNCM